MKKIEGRLPAAALSALLSCALIFSTVPLAAVPAVAADDGSTVTIYHTNDIHGNFGSAYNADGSLKSIGMDVLAAAKENTPNSLLVDSGDVSQGKFITAQTKGSFAFTLMNAANYDVMCLGNHEFDYGTTQLLSNVKSAKFPVLAANVQKSGVPLLKDVQSGIDGYDNNGESVIKTVAGKKIGFFGITTTETAYKTNPKNTNGVTFENETKSAQTQADSLKAKGADVVVGILHVGVDSSSNPTSEMVAENTSGIDAILDGHSHTLYNKEIKNKAGKDVCIDQTGSSAANVGVLKINFASGSPVITSENDTPADFGKTFKADEKVTAIFDAKNAELKPMQQAVIGRTQNALYGGTYESKSVCRADETNLGSLISDAMVEKASELVKDRKEYISTPIVALENGGGVRKTIPAGNITIADVNDVLPFGNTISVKEVTPAILYKTLEVGCSGTYKDGQLSAVGGFPQVGGMRFEFDVSKPAYVQGKVEGNRISKIVLLDKNGKDSKVLSRTDTKTKILLASNDFTIAGGDGYTMLSGLKGVAESDGLDVVTQNFITALTTRGKGSFRYDTHNRCVILNSGAPVSEYTGSFIVKQNDKPLAATKVLVSIDGAPKTALKTNGAGSLAIDLLKAGGHAIEVYTASGTKIMDEFTNNLLGLNSVVSTKPFTCDTTAAVKTKIGHTYYAMVTVPTNYTVNYTSGNGKVLATLARKPMKNAANDTVSYLFGYKAVKQGKAGLYVTINGKVYKLYESTAA
ncbi:MAG: bifunctional metallophosphatase/5'-nucleotidase [Oscillospiraceae bacterium]|jgi:2',3'-cyclic-nucleotide 2'-phosphodiesterase (5'-nucleotidase family)|nr:bifunctional metallophosphatase/5'-nucleotidase [Oscillospiraceae bacterium]